MQGEACAWIAPQHMTAAEVFHGLRDRLAPLLLAHSRADGVMRLTTGERLDLWSLENPIANRGRGYARVVIDEAPYTTSRRRPHDRLDAATSGRPRSSRPSTTRTGRRWCSPTPQASIPDNFFYAMCADAGHGCGEYPCHDHGQPVSAEARAGGEPEAWQQRRERPPTCSENDPPRLRPGAPRRVRRLVRTGLLQPRQAAGERAAGTLPTPLRYRVRGDRHRLQDRHRPRRHGGDVLRL